MLHVIGILIDILLVLGCLGILVMLCQFFYAMIKEPLFPKKQDNSTTITFQINVKQPDKNKEVSDK